MFIVVNFSHPLNELQCEAIQVHSQRAIDRIIDVPTQLDQQRTFASQAVQLFASIDLTPEQWQTATLVVRLPGLETIAALILAEVHGRCGYFPTIVRLRPVPGNLMREYEVAELLPLQDVRERARETRDGGTA